MSEELVAPDVEEVSALEDPFTWKDRRTEAEKIEDLKKMIAKALGYFFPSFSMYAHLAGAPHGGSDGEQSSGEEPSSQAAG
jgi:hypothetical protein